MKTRKSPRFPLKKTLLLTSHVKSHCTFWFLLLRFLQTLVQKNLHNTELFREEFVKKSANYKDEWEKGVAIVL